MKAAVQVSRTRRSLQRKDYPVRWCGTSLFWIASLTFSCRDHWSLL